MFDLYIFPLVYDNQTEKAAISGFFIGTPQRRTARTRETDIIVFKFSSARNLTLEEDVILTKILEKTANNFFKTNGPVTTAIQISSNFLNESLVKYNKGKATSEILAGIFQVAVIREQEAYFGHAGAAYSFIINSDKPMVFANKAGGVQGLGVSLAIKLAFHRVELLHGDRLVMTAHPPAGWTRSAINQGSRTSINQLRKTLVDTAGQDFDAIVMQVRNGTGVVHKFRIDSRTSSSQNEEELDHEIDNQPDTIAGEIPAPQPNLSLQQEQLIVTELERDLSEVISETNFSHDTETTDPKIPPVSPVSMPVQIPDLPTDTVDVFPNTETPAVPENDVRNLVDPNPWQDSQAPMKVNRDKDQKERSLALKKKMAGWVITVRNGLLKASNRSESLQSSLSEGAAKIISKANPAGQTNSSSLSLTSMFFIAILVPVVVVAIATTVYFRSGRGEQHQKFVIEASARVSQANVEVDNVKRLIVLQDALVFLDEADKFGKTDASQELRLVVQQQLDDLQGVTRLRLQSTIPTGLDRRMKISRMVVNANEDIYALDQETGRVLRLLATRPEYEVDTSFMCGPGKYESVIVHELVDIELISYSNSLNATLMGIDRAGNLLLCSPAKSPVAISLKVPELGWGHIQAIAFNGYSLYLLDVDERTRDLYRLPAEGLTFSNNPESIFNGNIPTDLAKTTDMAIYEDNLFVLSQAGTLMECTLGNVQIQCQNNVGYGIIQSGLERQTSEVIAGTSFSQLQSTQPPDPSLYFMDQSNNSVYHFSLSLNMQKQIRPDFVALQSTPVSPLTAFTVSPYGIMHFAFGHELYFGYIP